MSESTPNRGLIKEEATDDPGSFYVRQASNMDNLDVHTHPASDINTGTVDPSRLGTGNDGSGDNFLADDGTWKVPAGGGGSVDAADVTFTPTGNIASTDTHSAIAEVDAEKAPITHTHSAAEITSGTVDTARQGTGTANANTLLHGDQTWGGVNASTQLTAGTVPTARLGSGSATSSTPLWGDQSYRSVTATDIASGTVARARLGTGSDGSGDNFLADDATWKAVPQNLPTGGTTDQALVKLSGTDYDVGFADVLNATSHDLLDHSTVAGTIELAELADVSLGSVTAGDTIYNTIFGWVPRRAFVRDGVGAPTIYTSDGTPSSPASGDYWIKQSGLVYRYTGSVWENTQNKLVYNWTDGDTWGSWTQYHVNDDAGRNTYTLSEQTDTSPYFATTGAKFGRVAWASGASGSHRLFLVPDALQDYEDLEILTLWKARNNVASGKPQMGHAHRIINAGLSSQRAIVTWVDSIFALDDVINVGQWVGGGASPGSITQVDVDGPAMESLTTISRTYTKELTSNVATVTIDARHDMSVGDRIQVSISDAIFDGDQTVTAVTPTTVSYAKTHADVTLAAASGFVRPYNRAFPYWVCSRTLGAKFQVKVWRRDLPEPSWSDSRAVRSKTMTTAPPTGVGKHGLVIAHIGQSGESLDFGPIIFRTPTGRD